MEDITLKHLKRIARNSRLHAAAVASLSEEIDRLNVAEVEPLRARKYAEAWLVHSEALANSTQLWFPITRRLDSIARQAFNARREAADMAEAAADTVMITEGVTKALKMAYYPLARAILLLMPDLFISAIREVASHGGGAQLAALRDAINEVLSPGKK